MIPLDNIDEANNLFIERDQFAEENIELIKMKSLLKGEILELNTSLGFKDELIAANDSIIANRNQVIINKDLIIDEKENTIKKVKKGKFIAWLAAAALAVVAILK